MSKPTEQRPPQVTLASGIVMFSSVVVLLTVGERLSTLRSVNRVFLLKNGHVEAAGSHNDLWRDNDHYRRLQVLSDASGTEHAPLRGGG